MELRIYSNLFDIQARAVQEGENTENNEMYAEGWAIRFDSPTVLFSFGGVDYSEQIDRNALDEADMSDVIFNYNHGGKVVARTKNHTLELSKDDTGLYIKAKLDGTDEGRRLYDEIRGGYIDKMSFRFSIQEESFDKDKKLYTVRKIKRLYDVSAVDFPAYNDTSINARAAELYNQTERQENLYNISKIKALIKTKI